MEERPEAGEEDSSAPALRILRKLILSTPFFIIPFLGSNHLTLFYITIDKFWIESIYLLSLLGGIAAVTRKKSGDLPRESRDFFKYFLPFALVFAASLIYTWNFFNTLSGINILLWVIGSVYLYLNLKEHRYIALTALVAGTFVSALCALVQYKIVFPELMKTFSEGRYAAILGDQSGVPISSFIHYNMLGGYLAFVLPLAIYLAVVRRKAAYIIVSSIILTALALTTSRIALGLAALSIVFTAGYAVYRKNAKELLLSCLIVAIALSMSFVLIKSSAGPNHSRAYQALGEKIKNAPRELRTINTRTDIWKTGVRAFAEKPIIGYGGGCFEYAFRKCSDGSTYTIAAHSTILKMLVELGVVGLAAFLIYIWGLLPGVRICAKTPETLFTALAALWGLLFGLVDFSFEIPAHIITFFVLSSTLLVRTHVKRPARQELKWSKLVPLGIVICLVGSFFFTLRAELSGKSIENGTTLEETGLPAEAYDAYQDAIHEMPLKDDGYVLSTMVLVKSNRSQNELEKWERNRKALVANYQKMNRTGDKNSEIYFALALSCLALDKPDEAVPYFEKALYYYPSSAYYTYETARFYFLTNRPEKAMDLIRSYRPYVQKFRYSANPNGILIHKINDLESTIAWEKGDKATALAIARQNLSDAENRAYMTGSSRAREFVPRDVLIRYLTERVNGYGG